MKFNEMVLYPNESQFNMKSGELMMFECYWTIPFFPKNRTRLIGTKIYFYDKQNNAIILRATITEFGYHNVKKTVVFELMENDEEFYLDLDKLGYPKRKQVRGWSYRWFKLEA